MVAALAGGFTFEITPAAAMKMSLDTLSEAARLPVPPKVYVTKLPGHPMQHSIDAVRLLRDAGLEPIPHIAARGVTNRAELEDFVRKLGCRRVLVIGGSIDHPLGEFDKALDVVTTGALEQNGVTDLVLGAHPQGADNIPPAVLEKAFADKLHWAQTTGRERFDSISWCTQLCYSADVLQAWEQSIRLNQGNTLKIQVGVPGQASMAQLARYAAMSGVANSVNFFRNSPSSAWSLLTKRSVLDDIVDRTSRYRLEDSEQLFGSFHFYSFGALPETLRWACKVSRGEFDIGEVGRIVLHE